MGSKHVLSFINDEVGLAFEPTLRFACRQGISGLEMRSVLGRNLLTFSRPEIAEFARRLRQEGLAVVGLASPLLKWAAPGRPAGPRGDQFGFELGELSLGEVARRAAWIAHALGTRNIRIFSFLSYPAFELSDLYPALDELLSLAEREDLILHVENEPVCNLRTERDLLTLLEARPHPRLRALLDIGNVLAAGAALDEDCLRTLMPYVDHMHFKDFSASGGRRHVALGEGDIPYDLLLPACLEAAQGRSLTLSIETHVPQEALAATERSLSELRRLLARAPSMHIPRAG